MDTKFASLKALLELADSMDSLPDTTAVKLQKDILLKTITKAFDEFMMLGVSLPDLF
jgi:hypothetical protein